MAEILPTRPLCFLDQEAVQEAGDEIIIPERLLNMWIDMFVPGTPMLATLTHLETDRSRVVCIGASDKSEGIYAPRWILDHLGCLEEQRMSIRPYLQEVPMAIRISLRPMDNAAYHSDLRQAFEIYLDRFHVMEAGTTLSVSLEELGGYEICGFVESVEPPGLVALGGEVQIEFLEPEGGIPEHEPEPEPEPEPAVVETPTTDQTNQVVPMTADQRTAMRESWLKRFANLNTTT
jgi:hypothetical protein